MRFACLVAASSACGSCSGVSRPDAGVDAAPAAPHRVLFVGNSYLYTNDVTGHYRALVLSARPGVRVTQVARGGYRLAQHASEARADGTELALYLRTGTPEQTAHEFVVLQEQSQIGGFDDRLAERAASLRAAGELAALATARGATVVLYSTWGYERGDAANAGLGYGTYVGMQERLDAGYRRMAAQLRAQGATVRVAPAGAGFRAVYEDAARAGADPAAEGSEFDALYEPDGSHPSRRGAYLAACVIAGTTTGDDVRRFEDEPILGPEVSRRLRDACARALASAPPMP